eukprot:2442777-Alexandrium_andersonii.AAC.1
MSASLVGSEMCIRDSLPARLVPAGARADAATVGMAGLPPLAAEEGRPRLGGPDRGTACNWPVGGIRRMGWLLGPPPGCQYAGT